MSYLNDKHPETYPDLPPHWPFQSAEARAEYDRLKAEARKADRAAHALFMEASTHPGPFN